MKTTEDMDIVFLLDRSGSMSGIEEDTIGGYNNYIKRQRKNKRHTRVTTILFDDQYEVLLDGEDIQKVKEITPSEYYVKGCTALFDAIGKTINHIKNKVKNKVLFVITTDGLENASKEYNKEQIRNLIKEHNNWEFIYIGANIDSYKEGTSIGIEASNISNYKKTKKGTKNLFNAIERATNCLYECSYLKEDWKDNLENQE